MTAWSKALEAEVREHNAAVDELERDFRAGVPDAVEEFFTQVLALSEYPSGFPSSTRSPTGRNPVSWSSSTGCRRWT